MIPRSYQQLIITLLIATDQLFSMGIKDLMHHLKDVVERWYELGVQLDVPISRLNEIRCNNSSNVYQCKLLMLQEWQRRPTLNPSWFTLVDALRKMEENVIADKIAQQFSELCTHNCCHESRLVNTFTHADADVHFLLHGPQYEAILPTS